MWLPRQITNYIVLWQIVALLYKCSYISFVTVWSVSVATGKEGPPSCQQFNGWETADGRQPPAHRPQCWSVLIYSTIRPDEGKKIAPFDPAMLVSTSPCRYITPTHPYVFNTSFWLIFCPPLGVSLN